ncbi:sugar nucleotide-binding protein [Nocardiopsis exhalans]|uniref:Sugar nucleotide-binding protein n=1 Tax=Nocardiopsis exhalans TaxID=163604 RepID=A0ABY5D1X2_9ACTN|nr:sugar nucleotide-binding protein [Nocardiopsis exhalans]USY17126.1 sugar nucleotide-binding protein [Nocardiopsis exhalans]
MTLLIVGATGLLGTELLRQTTTPDSPHTHNQPVTATFHTRPPNNTPHVHWTPLDLRSRDQVHHLITTLRPHTVINAAYRQHDWPTTAHSPTHLAQATTRTRTRLIHVSSDAVFSGHTPHYDETAHPDPTTPYGAAKAAAETAIAALDPTAVIARTSLIIGNGHSTHEQRVRALATGAATGALFTDDIRCPVHVQDLAAALLELTDPTHTGIYHLVGSHALSRHTLGTLIARQQGLDPDTLPRARRAEVGPPGPLELRLDARRTRQRLTTRLRGAHEFLS